MAGPASHPTLVLQQWSGKSNTHDGAAWSPAKDPIPFRCWNDRVPNDEVTHGQSRIAGASNRWDKDESALLRSGKRYTSNITIVEQEAELRQPPQDVLLRPLAGYTKGGVFTGAYEAPGRGDIEKNFEHSLAQIYARTDTPRLSDVQIKAPMCLDEKCVLSPATGKPFTPVEVLDLCRRRIEGMA